MNYIEFYDIRCFNEVINGARPEWDTDEMSAVMYKILFPV